jgi:hypothetical protein
VKEIAIPKGSGLSGRFGKMPEFFWWKYQIALLFWNRGSST